MLKLETKFQAVWW